MKKARKAVSLVIISIFALSFMSLMGCTKHPNTEQLQTLEEQKQAALAAEQQLEEKKREKSRLESDLERKRKELADAKKELEEVKRRLGQ